MTPSPAPLIRLRGIARFYENKGGGLRSPQHNLHRTRGREIMELFRRPNDEAVTIVQLTHNEAWARCGNRIIELSDSWMVGGADGDPAASGSVRSAGAPGNRAAPPIPTAAGAQGEG